MSKYFKEYLINELTSGTIKTKKYYAARRLYKLEDVSSDDLKNGGFTRAIEYSAYEILKNRCDLAIKQRNELAEMINPTDPLYLINSLNKELSQSGSKMER
jgi:hypothetical protein